MQQDRSDDTVMEVGKAEAIVEKLKAQIIEGKLPERTKLPSERELSQRYNVSRMTVHRALELLESEGFITRYPGHGTFVGGGRERLNLFQGRQKIAETEHSIVKAEELRQAGSFIKEMERLGHKPEVRWLEQPALIAASPKIADQLQLPNHMLVLKRHRLQIADGLPYRLVTSYYPADLFGESLTTSIGEVPLFDWLQIRHRLAVEHAREELTVRLATMKERSLLRISPNSPVVDIKRKVWADNGRVVEWAIIIAVAAWYTFSYDYQIPEQIRGVEYEQ